MSWADLPPDLLRLISGSSARPIAQFRSIFSKTTWCARAPGTCNLRNRWLATEGGAGAWLLTSEASPSPSLRLVDPFTGVATNLPPFADQTPHHIQYDNGIVLADGTVVMFTCGDYSKYDAYIWAAVLRPGENTAWMEGQTHLLMNNRYRTSWAAAYHKGELVLVEVLQVGIVKLRVPVASGGNNGDVLDEAKMTRGPHPWSGFPEQSRNHGPQPRPQGIYTFESRGELLAACLLVDTTGQDGGDSPAGAMSVSVYALEQEAVDSVDNPRFAVDAERYGGAVSGGCAYFVFSSRKARSEPKACRVYRYSFEDGSATVVEELAGWGSDTLVTWFVPQPSAIAPVCEIREKKVSSKIETTSRELHVQEA
ncbi:hypothetical protein BAE44_0021556 [Dichanthelium oligosanthes]|uniref:KIB1-4 beta-propeller domain-containing protein n=1 Tax=Dichanthelium oligosanthes TaxID=888268 RepID=A0A1E5UXD0_9POAL|nr:hypothetical protein BAE44_0021556 [Dichanthelium oligosanthes]